MAYTPTVWETGEVITAEKLNKAENGIAAASADKILLTGKIESSDMTTYTFTLLTGDAAEISIDKEVYIRASVEIGGGKLSDVILPLTSTNIDANGAITYYSFPVVVSVGIMGILFFEVRYNTPPEDPTHKYWSASVSQLTS